MLPTIELLECLALIGRLLLSSLLSVVQVQPTLPSLPRAVVDGSMPDTRGYTVIQVNAGAHLQAAVNKASCNPNGTLIKIQAGASFNGSFVLPAKRCAPGKWIIIRSDTDDSNLPAPGVRITPAYASFLPKIVANQTNVPAIQVALSATNYRLIGLYVSAPGSGVYNGNNSDEALIDIGFGDSRQNTASLQPTNIIVDRCLIRGSDSPPIGQRRGVDMECSNCAIVESYIDQMHQIGADSQAIGGWNSTGPWLIRNNYLSASGENILIGGADPAIPNAIPSDITVTRNYFFKPHSWKVGDPSYAGTRWEVKNLLELKLGVRVLIEGNVLENNWVDGQVGIGILVKSSNSNNTAPWSQTADVTLRHNKMIGAEGGAVDVDGWNGVYPSRLTARVNIHDNVFDIQGGASGRYFGVFTQATSVTFDHNTLIFASPSPSSAVAFESPVPAGQVPYPGGFGFHNSIFYRGNWGISENCKVGGLSVNCFTADSWWRNLVYGTSPAGTWCSKTNRGTVWAVHAAACPVSDLAAVKFVDATNHNYRLAPRSPGKNSATDGKDAGADIDGVDAATAGTVGP